MQKLIFFLDLDGTLADDTFLPEENRIAIRKAREQGHLVFLNTGRAPAFIPEWLFHLIDFDGIIAGSGAFIRIGEEILQQSEIPLDTVAKNCIFLERTGRQCIFEGIRSVVVLSPTEELPFPTLTGKEELLCRYNGIGVEKLNLKGKLTFAEKRYFSSFYDVIQHETYAECSIPGTNKGTAMNTIMARYPDRLSVAIGDSANDIDMLACADISIAMGNAPEKIQHICSHQTDDVQSGGVGKAICTLIESLPYGKELTL